MKLLLGSNSTGPSHFSCPTCEKDIGFEQHPAITLMRYLMNISELYKLKAETERAISVQRDWERYRQRLLALPKKLGFDSVKDLVAALGLASRGRQIARGTPPTKRKARRQITEALRQKVK